MRRRRYPTHQHSPRAGRTPRGRPFSPEAQAEQNAMNEVLKKLYGPNARQLNPDGIVGPATRGVQELIDRSFPPDAANNPNESRADRMKRLSAFLDTPEGQRFRADPVNSPAMQDLNQGINALPDTPNGFIPGTGMAPTPSAAPSAAPEAPSAAPSAAPEAPSAAPSAAATPSHPAAVGFSGEVGSTELPPTPTRASNLITGPVPPSG